MRCPHCGHLILDEAPEILWNQHTRQISTRFGSVTIAEISLFPVLELLFNKRHTYGLTVERIIEILFMNDPDGGVCEAAIRVRLRRLRRALCPIGLAITNNCHGGGYRLVLWDPDRAIEHVAALMQRRNRFLPNKVSPPISPTGPTRKTRVRASN